VNALRRGGGPLLATATAFLLVLAACGGENDETETAPPPRSQAEAAERGWQRVIFRASDGVRLDGRLYGGWRDVVVVLSHMGRGGDTQADWYPVAQTLAAEGYGALTYNRRGVCPRHGDGCSRGFDDLPSSWKDVLGAYRRARTKGAGDVVLVGASIGAMSSLYAAGRNDVAVAAIVEVGGINNASGYRFAREDIARIEGLTVFASSEGDVYGGADAAREWHGWAREPKELTILPGDGHGTDLLRDDGATARRLTEIIVDAIRRATA
jgi:dienelactone hydrolase